MEACTICWVQRCLKCQARKTSRQTVRWPILPVPLPHSAGISVSVDYFGPLPTTARGNSYILTAEGTANILVNRYIPLWGCPSTLLSDNGPQFCAQLATAVYQLLGIRKLTTSAYHPSGNGGVERVNHTMAQILPWFAMNTRPTGTSTFPMLNTRTTTLSNNLIRFGNSMIISMTIHKKMFSL